MIKSLIRNWEISVLAGSLISSLILIVAIGVELHLKKVHSLEIERLKRDCEERSGYVD